MISPSSFAVRALKFLQKSMMLTPCGPSAVPTGAAGVFFPAAIWSFTIACTFFAMLLLLNGGVPCTPSLSLHYAGASLPTPFRSHGIRSRGSGSTSDPASRLLQFLYLQEI